MAKSESAGVSSWIAAGKKAQIALTQLPVPGWNRAATFLSNSNGRLNFDAQLFHYAHK
jgi:hypothetical protein